MGKGERRKKERGEAKPSRVKEGAGSRRSAVKYSIFREVQKRVAIKRRLPTRRGMIGGGARCRRRKHLEKGYKLRSKARKELTPDRLKEKL